MSWRACPDPIPGERDQADAIETVAIPRSVDVGGFEVHRVMPTRQSQMVGPFIFFDQMGPGELLTAQGIDVRPHPHINLATVTYLFDGEIVHRDSLGTEQAISPGAVNWMKAGKGIVHSERSGDQERQEASRVFGLQTWVALPEEHEESDAAFRHHSADELPVVEDHGIRARILAGSAFGAASPLKAASDTLYAEVKMEAGEAVSIPSEYTERAIYTLTGDVEVGGKDFPGEHMLVLKPGASVDVVARSSAHFMLFGGAPMDGPRFIWWNFVSSRLDRIEQAKEEWATGKFDTVPGDAEEFIPLPETVGTPRPIRPMSDPDGG
ncbi:MAG: pirin family protein [Myxococcota bacterium]